jgi:hypothetical protein
LAPPFSFLPTAGTRCGTRPDCGDHNANPAITSPSSSVPISTNPKLA